MELLGTCKCALISIVLLSVSANSIAFPCKQVAADNTCDEAREISLGERSPFIVVSGEGDKVAHLQGYFVPGAIESNELRTAHEELQNTLIDSIAIEPPNIRWFEGITIVDTTNRTQRKISLGDDVLVSSLAWSPNSEHLAYLSRNGDDVRLNVFTLSAGDSYQVDGLDINSFVEGQFSRMFPEGRSFVPYHWSHDSRAIVFAVHSGGRPSVLNVSTKASSPIIYDTETAWGWDKGSLDAQHELVGAELSKSAIFSLDVATGKTYQILQQASLKKISLPRFSGSHGLAISEEPSGDQDTISDLVFSIEQSVDGGSFQIGESHLATEIDAAGQLLSPVWTEGGNGVFWVSERTPKCVSILSLGDRTSTDLTCLETRIEWIGGSEDYLFVYAGSGLHRFSLDDGEYFGQVQLDTDDSSGLTNLHKNALLMRGSSDEVYVGKGAETLVLGQVAGARPSEVSWTLSELTLSDGTARIVKPMGVGNIKIARFGPMLSEDRALVLSYSDESVWDYTAIHIENGYASRLFETDNNHFDFRKYEFEELLYKREDGIQLAAKVLFPNNNIRWKKNGTFPVVAWVYPASYDSVGSYNDKFSKRPSSIGSINGWVGSGAIPFWLTLALLEEGFAVAYLPSFPLIGDDDETNVDRYPDQISKSARALARAVRRAPRLDGDRLVIAGHSQGGNTVAQVLANTDDYFTGISFAGAMNTSQYPEAAAWYEDDKIWESPDAFVRMSPVFYADKINEPLLMLHGLRDGNTVPIQSIGLYRSISALNGKARLVLFPYMEHNFVAREERLYAFREIVRWLENKLEAIDQQRSGRVSDEEG